MFEVGTPNTGDQDSKAFTRVQLTAAFVAFAILFGAVVATFGWWALLVIPLMAVTM